MIELRSALQEKAALLQDLHVQLEKTKEKQDHKESAVEEDHRRKVKELESHFERYCGGRKESECPPQCAWPGMIEEALSFVVVSQYPAAH